jgi:hypothetical protein
MKDIQRFAGAAVRDGDRIHPTWEAVISQHAVNVIFSNRHWKRAAKQPAWADGRSWLEADIDGVADAVRRGLRLQLGLECAPEAKSENLRHLSLARRLHAQQPVAWRGVRAPCTVRGRRA